MPTLLFLPGNQQIDAPDNAKILAVAIKNKINIRYGCGACRCGTCGIRISGDGIVSEMQPSEEALLKQMKLPVDGTIRLACQTRIQSGAINVDLEFQNSYSPDSGLDSD